MTATGLAIASGGDTWPTLSHDQSRSARSAAQGDVKAPQVAWKYSLGGSLEENQVAEADVNGDGITELIFVSAGRVVAKSATGKPVWVSENLGAQRVIGVYDLDGVAPAEVVVTGESPLGAYILSAQTGQTLWYEATSSTAFDLLAVPTGAGTTGGSCPAGYTCWTTEYDLAAPLSTGTPSPGFSDGDQATFTVTPYFLTTAGNSYQGASAILTLTAQAVQAPGNTLPNSCTIGQPCPGGGSFSWS